MLRFLRRERSTEGDRRAEAEKTRQAVEKSRQTWFGRLRSLLSSSQLNDAVWDELEEVLISADVGVDTSLALVERLKQQASQGGIHQPDQVWQALRRELVDMLEADSAAPASSAPTPPATIAPTTIPPTTILMVGVNGVGKTTSIAKLAQHFKSQGCKVVLGAGDTFRAAAIDQLQLWGRAVGADVIAHQQGGDPGAVVYDAFEAARARGADVLIIDTAGRLHTKSNLMDELTKIRRVLGRLDPSAPHEVVLTLDATTGQNGPDPSPPVHRGSAVYRHFPSQAGRHRSWRHRPCHPSRAGPAHPLHRHWRTPRRHRSIRPRTVRRCPARPGGVRGHTQATPWRPVV